MEYALGSRETPIPQRIANYVISCYYPKSPILLEILKEFFRRTKSIIHQEWTDKDVLWSTGPDVVTTVISQNLSNDLKVVDLKTRKKMMDHTAEGTWREHKDTVF